MKSEQINKPSIPINLVNTNLKNLNDNRFFEKNKHLILIDNKDIYSILNGIYVYSTINLFNKNIMSDNINLVLVNNYTDKELNKIISSVNNVIYTTSTSVLTKVKSLDIVYNNYIFYIERNNYFDYETEKYIYDTMLILSDDIEKVNKHNIEYIFNFSKLVDDLKTDGILIYQFYELLHNVELTKQSINYFINQILLLHKFNKLKLNQHYIDRIKNNIMMNLSSYNSYLYSINSNGKKQIVSDFKLSNLENIDLSNKLSKLENDSKTILLNVKYTYSNETDILFLEYYLHKLLTDKMQKILPDNKRYKYCLLQFRSALPEHNTVYNDLTTFKLISTPVIFKPIGSILTIINDIVNYHLELNNIKLDKKINFNEYMLNHFSSLKLNYTFKLMFKEKITKLLDELENKFSIDIETLLSILFEKVFDSKSFDNEFNANEFRENIAILLDDIFTKVLLK